MRGSIAVLTIVGMLAACAAAPSGGFDNMKSRTPHFSSAQVTGGSVRGGGGG